MSLPRVAILYRRLPDRDQVFEQVLLEEAPDRLVTFLESAELPRPVEVGGCVVLDPGSPVIWFTYPGRWHDLGLFHRRDGTFTGFYANIVTPVVIDGSRWETTDLCLDVWLGAEGTVEVLDEEDFEAARRAGWVDSTTATRAIREAETLASDARAGRWPLPHARAWDLNRVRARLLQLRTLAIDA